MKTIKFQLTGTAPLIMHAATLVDPFHPLAKEKKKLTAKKTNKTDDDLRRIDEIEFIAGLYMDEQLGPVVPSANVERMLVDAGKRTRLGNKVKMGLQAANDYMPLQYQGPRDLAGLLADPRFHFRQSIVQAKQRVMRERPWFHGWSLEVAIDYDEKTFDQDDIVSLMDVAGRYIGLGDWRPRYGRFTAQRVA